MKEKRKRETEKEKGKEKRNLIKATQNIIEQHMFSLYKRAVQCK
jgi:hypothetical protein